MDKVREGKGRGTSESRFFFAIPKKSSFCFVLTQGGDDERNPDAGGGCRRPAFVLVVTAFISR